MARSKFFLSIAALLLAGCAAKEPVVVTAKPLPVSTPSPGRLVLSPVPWQVYDRARLEQLLAANQDNPDFLLYALTPEGYRALNHDMIEIKRLLNEQGAIIVYLKTTAESPSKP